MKYKIYHEKEQIFSIKNDKHTELINTAWPKEKDRKAFMTQMNMAFTGIHRDYIYYNEPTLSK